MPASRLLTFAPLFFLALIGLSQPVAATSLEACLDDLAKSPPAEVAQRYTALLKAKKLPREQASWSHYCVGRAWAAADELKQAEPALRAAAKLAQSAEIRNAVQSFLGSVLFKMNRLDEAEAAHQAELAAAQEMGAAREQATALNNLGSIARQRKQYDQALALYTRSLTLQSDELKKTTVLSNMASVHHEKGNYALAVEVFQQAIAIDRRLDDRNNLAIHLLNLGSTYLALRQWKDVNAALDEGVALARANGSRYWEATGLMYGGEALRDDNQPVKARGYLNAALKIFKEIGAAGLVAEVEQVLSQLGNNK